MNYYDRVREVKAHFDVLARNLRQTDSLMRGWLPAWACVEIVCGCDWKSLSHGTKTNIGAFLRDRFQEEFAFEMTPIRLQSKASGHGSQMLAVYPPMWVLSKETVLTEMIGAEATPAQPMLPFEGDLDCD